MKNKQVTQGLERLFWFAGWAIIIVTVLGFLATINSGLNLNIIGIDGAPSAMGEAMHVFSKFRILIQGVAEAFFSFLMSSVFGMIFQGRPANFRQAENYMRITCVGIVLHSILSFSSWLLEVINYKPICLFDGDCTPYMKVMAFCSYSMIGIGTLVPVLYAITIFVLFHHFTRMVAFEAEVI